VCEVDNSGLFTCAGFDNNDVTSALELARCALITIPMH
jgi:preprotein translocase subunit SecB